MAKQLNVSLSFTADTNAAKREIQSLQTALNSLAKTGSMNAGQSVVANLNADLREGMQAAAELQAQLESAVNVNTGKLDLNKFNNSLKASGKTLNSYAASLQKLGPAGVQAFTQMTTAIVHAEAPLVRVNDRIKALGTSLANTARWQLSSGIVHGLIGGVQKAYYYAQDLNRSLNNIRIVTNYNTDQMKAFALEANKAAKALSTTTTNYTNASLIYYQQGLSDEEVKRRTDVTVKMANVTGETSEKISSQMTAVWNNFAQGSNNLEYFADVLVKLGAYTASSTDEITAGLEKFSSVAQTIGLSYEYASSALATITATTRESADVAGTALRTLFSRIQGLTLGETQDDGTNLNKYSEALSKVGINIKDTSGELKDMDTILNELGNKWTTLRRDQQMALAQTVAGVRQYNQLITLMNNWNYFQELVGVAKSSTGELNNQAKIFAESWLGASKRVQAAAEEIYNQLFKDDAFIVLTNGVSKVIESVGDLINGLGGLKGVLFTIGSIASKVFRKEIAQGLQSTVMSLRQLTPAGRAAFEQSKIAAVDLAIKNAQEFAGSSGDNQAALMGKFSVQELEIQKSLLKYQDHLTDAQTKEVQIRLDVLHQLQEQLRVMGEIEERAKNISNAEKRSLINEARTEYRAKLSEINEQGNSKSARKSAEKIAKRQLVDQRTAEYNDYLQETYQKSSDMQGYGTSSRVYKNWLEKSGWDNKEEYSQKLEQLIEEIIYKAIEEAKIKARDNLNAREAEINAEDILGASMGRLQVLSERQASLSALFTNRPDEEGIVEKDVKDIQFLTDEYNDVLKTLDNIKNTDAFKNVIGDQDYEKLQKFVAKLNEGLAIFKKLKNEGKTFKDAKGALGATFGQSDEDSDSPTESVPHNIAENATNELPTTSVQAGQEEERRKIGEQNTDQWVDDTNQDIYNKAITQLNNWSNQVTQITSAMMTLGSVISSVQGLVDVFSNPDTTGWEKFIAVFTQMTFIVPQIMSTMTSITKVIQAQKLAHAKATGAAVAHAKAEEVVGNKGMVAGKKVFAGGMMGQMGWLWLTLIAAGIIALVAALTIIIKNIEAAKLENRLKTAEENTKKLGEAAEEAKNEYQELLDTINNYDTAVSNLNKLTVGTDEFAQALQKANAEAKKLIEDYNISDFTINAQSGLIEFEEGTLSEVKNKYKNFASNAEIAANAAQKYENSLKLQMVDESVGKKSEASLDSLGTVRFGLIPTYASAVKYLPGVNKRAIEDIDFISQGGWSGSPLGVGAMALWRHHQKQSIQKFAIEDINKAIASGNIKEYFTNDSEFVKKYGESTDNLVETMTLMAQSAQEQKKAIEANTKALIAQQVQDNEAYVSSKYKNEIATILATTEQSKINKEIEEINKEGIESAFDEMAKILGADSYDIGTWFDGKTAFYKDGKSIGDYSDEQVANMVAAARVAERQDADLQIINAAVTKLYEAVKSNDAKTAGLNALFNQNAGELTPTAIKNILRDNFQLADLGDIDLLKNLYGEDLTSAKTDLITLAKTAQSQIDNISKSMLSSVATTWSLIPDELKDQTLSIQLALADQMNTIFAQQGSEGLSIFTSAINTLSAKDLPKLISLVSQVDWSKGNESIDQFKKLCAEAGIKIENNDELWTAFANIIQQTSAKNVIKDLDTITSQLQNILSIVHDLKTGDIINEDKYLELLKHNADYAQYFSKDYKGDYVFTGTNEDIRNLAYAQAGLDLDANNAQKADEKSAAESFSKDQINLFAQKATTDIQEYKDFDGKQQTEYLAAFEDVSDFYDKNPELAQRALGLSQEAFKNTLSDFKKSDLSSEKAEQLFNNLQGVLNKIIGFSDKNDLGLLEPDTMFSIYSRDVNNSTQLDNLYSAANSEEGIDDETKIRNTAAYSDALKLLGSRYESCREALDNYNKAIKEGDFEKIAQAQNALNKAIKDAEWEELTKKCRNNIEALKDFKEESEEAAKIYNELAQDLSQGLDVPIDASFIKKHYKLIEEALEAEGEMATKKWMQIKDQAQFAFAYDTSAFGDVQNEIEKNYSNIQNIINNNPIVMTATGNADFTGLMNALFEAGLTAEAVAKILQELGYTDVVLEGEATGVEELQAAVDKMNNASTPEEKSEAYLNFVKAAKDKVKMGITLNKAVVPREAPSPDMKTINGSKKKSGGGGGGQDSKKEPKKPKDEIERYHEIKNTLEDLEREYNRVKKARDRAYGMTKVALIQEEIKKTKELAEAQKQYMTEINDNLIDDQKALAAFGATFDSRGNIDNYDSLVAGWVAEFNASLTDEAEKAYQDKVDALNQYEETHDLWQDEYDKLIDYYNQIVDLELEAITVEVDFKIELSEKEIERVEYEIEKLTRSRTLNIDIQINKMGDYIPEYMKQSKEYQDAIQKIYDSAMKYGLTELTQDQWDTIKDYQSKLLELNLKMLDKVQEVEEKFNEAIDKMTERFDEAEGRFETYSSILEHFSDTMELLGMNTKDFATYQKLLQQRMDTSIATIDNNKKRLDTYNQALAETKEALARAVEQGDQENILFWQEKVRELETASEEAYEAFISSWQSTIEAATEFFESKVEAIIQHFKDNLFVDGLDAMADKLDKVNDVRERYLDDFDRWYEISKLNREIDKEIDDTSNLSAKRRLADFQKEILKYQEEGVLMSQYDLDHARARYELLLAEIALEEARNAKNTVQLKRDSEGNWGYVYTADQDKIAEAEQNYEDKLHDMQEAAKDYRDEMESQVIDALNNMFEELGGLDKNAADYQEKAWKIYQFYYDKLQYLAVEFDKALADSNSTLADTVFADEGIMTDFLTYITKLMNDVKDAPEQLINQYKDLQDTIRKANESAGIDSDNFSNNVIINIDWVNGKTEDLAKDMDSFMEDISDSITKVIDTIQTWKETYLSAIRDMMAANEKWNLSSYEVPAGYDSWEDYFKEHPPEIDWDWKPSYTGEAGGEYRGYMVGNESNSGTSGGSGNADDSDEKSGGDRVGGYRIVPLPERKYDISDANDVIEEFYNHGKESQYAKEQALIAAAEMAGKRYQGQVTRELKKGTSKKDKILKSFYASKLYPGLIFAKGYDTGGYTGDWGTSDGKVALLHEKELVLNKKDTANILDSVNIVRDMNNQINRNIRYASFAQQVAAQIKGQLQNELKQNVEIQATFPSVTNSNEIEDAFNNLVNAAAQYVNSKIQ